jgi:hypothetical protein
MDKPLQSLQQQTEQGCRLLLSAQNRDPYTATWGCFDRRYWAWKLVDFPEATYQRNVYPLAWFLRHTAHLQEGTPELVQEAIIAGLQFALHIQHRDGSFDQAFPHEHSFGATAFLLHPLLEAYRIVRDHCSPTQQHAIENSLRRAADFLCRHDETHGHIANHLAGAALSLLVSAEFFWQPAYEQRAMHLLERILAHQSPEGWFLEYEGADPGYQTLCLYYLAQIYRLRPDSKLHAALKRAITFLAWFVHPDGTFGGEYGSRRTAIFYPGGVALLSRTFPLAHSIIRAMLASIAERRTVTLLDVDMGNLAPLLSNYVTVLEADMPDASQPVTPLPWQLGAVQRDFPRAGIFIRGTPRHYAVVGSSNGGVLKVFDRHQQRMLWNDGGYVGHTNSNTYITTQMTDLHRSCQATTNEIMIQAPFYLMLRSVPTPLQFLVLRALNLTVMRHVALGNMVKALLVRLLISGKHTVPLHLKRTITFAAEYIRVTDTLTMTGSLQLRWLQCGHPFVAIHMASARYFENAAAVSAANVQQVDVAELAAQGTLHHQVTIC